MKVHYFQRYNTKENVATANTMLLLSRLYAYSSTKFFTFLKNEFFSDSINLELNFDLQVKEKNNVLDAVISQESLKIVVETKQSDWFYEDQLIKYLKNFQDEKYKLFITLASTMMKEGKKRAFDEKLKEYNKNFQYPIIHINTTFEKLIRGIQDVLDDRDLEMQDILNDYLDYCYSSGLTTNSWKYMRVRSCGQTFDFDFENNVYYDQANHSFAPHDILGLYKDKSVRAIGKIVAKIIAYEENKQMVYEAEEGSLTEKRKEIIQKAVKDGYSHGFDLKNIPHRYFFVEQFYETDFKKISLRAPMGPRLFDLTQVLEKEEVPPVEILAEELKKKTWM